MSTESEAGQLRNQRLLLVEDDLPTRKTLDRLLSMSGFEVSSAADAPAALEALGGGRFDIVLTDYDLKGQDCGEVVAAARSRHPSGLVAILTGGANAESRGAMNRLEVDFILTKPLKIDDLLDRLERELSKKAAGD
jgi:DNA-binding response OmpR family regulator